MPNPTSLDARLRWLKVFADGHLTSADAFLAAFTECRRETAERIGAKVADATDMSILLLIRKRLETFGPRMSDMDRLVTQKVTHGFFNLIAGNPGPCFNEPEIVCGVGV